ncbi:MAG TPA: hypothetical protein VHQ01_06420, partial [Pyrinomonadaceae bacterium]|nr:hypothetical protein [Pyrinomonadaceae bacterium]
MNVLRNIAGVIVGYLIFAVAAVMLFGISGTDPHADAGSGTMTMVILCGGAFAFVGGYVAKLIASTRTMIANFVLALIMAGFAAFSLFMSAGNHYTQIAAIFLFAPLSLFGGFLRRRS